jgi:hypothetical protein
MGGKGMAKPDRKRGPGVVPYALGLVVCDAIWRDPTTGKRTILGCFSAIQALSFPAKHPMFSVYAALTSGHGEVPISLRLVDVDEAGPPLVELKAKAKFEDPRVILEVDFVLMNTVFPGPGEYRLQLRSGETLLMERRIAVLEVGGQTHDADSESGPS